MAVQHGRPPPQPPLGVWLSWSLGCPAYSNIRSTTTALLVIGRQTHGLGVSRPHPAPTVDAATLSPLPATCRSAATALPLPARGCGGAGRRRGLKLLGAARPVWVRTPPPARCRHRPPVIPSPARRSLRPSSARTVSPRREHPPPAHAASTHHQPTPRAPTTSPRREHPASAHAASTARQRAASAWSGVPASVAVAPTVSRTSGPRSNGDPCSDLTPAPRQTSGGIPRSAR